MERKSKALLCAAVTAALYFPVSYAEDSKLAVSGFVDITYTAVDDTAVQTANKSPTEKKFAANGEVDFAGKLADKVSVRVDTDLDLVTNGGANVAGSDSARIEQAFFAYSAMDKVTVIAGVFNNPIGLEKEDAPDMLQTTHGQIWAIMDGQTALNGNNIAGLAAAVNVASNTTVTVGLLNDLQQTNEKNSLALALNVTPMKNLDLEAGYVSQASRADAITAGSATAGGATYGSQGTVVGSAENWWDVNATYKYEGLTVSAEYLAAKKIVDGAYGVTGNYMWSNGFGVTARYDVVSYGDPFDTVKDTKTATLAGSYMLAKNLTALLEYRTQDDPNDTDGVPGGGIISDGDLVQVEFVANF